MPAMYAAIRLPKPTEDKLICEATETKAYPVMLHVIHRIAPTKERVTRVFLTQKEAEEFLVSLREAMH